MTCSLFPHKVDIHAAQVVNDTVGNRLLYPPEGGSVKHKKLRCLIEPLSADQVVEMMHKGFQATHRLYFRQALGLVSTDRIVFGSRKFECKGEVDVGEQGKLIMVTAEEVK